MICPVCKRATKRLVYKGAIKQCPDCNDPNFIRAMVPNAPDQELVGRLQEWIDHAWDNRPAIGPIRCVIVPQMHYTNFIVCSPATSAPPAQSSPAALPPSPSISPNPPAQG